MISLPEARQIIFEKTKALPHIAVSLASAQGRVLATSVASDAFYPSGDRATMDGYALREDATPGGFRVAGETAAGAAQGDRLKQGEAHRVFTGALVPENTGRVIPQELAHREGGNVRIEQFPKPPFIRKKGSEAIPGTVVLKSGTVLQAPELAILAQVGCVNPLVFRLPLIKHLATGEELVGPEHTPAVGQIRDTNSTLLAALSGSLGLPIDSQRVPDDLDQLLAAADGENDLLLLSGGASVGDYDFGRQTLRRLGYTIHFEQVNLRPGKPLVFASRNNLLAFVIPGNPVSHFVCWHVAIKLALEVLTGKTPMWTFLTLALSQESFLENNPRDTFWPGQVSIQNGSLVVTPLPWSTSGNTFSLAGTNALIRVPADWKIASPVETLLLDVSLFS